MLTAEVLILAPVILLSGALLLVTRFYAHIFARLERYLEIGQQLSAAEVAGDPLNEASQTEIGGTSFNPAPALLPAAPSSGQKPLFRTLRVEEQQQGNAKWRLRIRFLLANRAQTPIVLDDIHTILYERDVHTAPFLTVSYRGEILLQQDNTIYKEERIYSLDPGEGMEVTLALDLTRVEGAPIYGVDDVCSGPVTTVFGLLVDYYAVTREDILRNSLPSDCLYVFQYDNRQSKVTSVDEKQIEAWRLKYQTNRNMSDFVQTVERHLKKHQLFSRFPSR